MALHHEMVGVLGPRAMTLEIPEPDHGHPFTIGGDVEPLLDEVVDRLARRLISLATGL